MKNILILDDESIVLEVLQRILQHLGHQVTTTENIDTAMKHFASSQYDLVLLDVLMPDKTGYEIAKSIKKIKPEQKIMFVTGAEERSVKRRLKSENIDVSHVLSKPFSYNKVKSQLESLFEEA